MIVVQLLLIHVSPLHHLSRLSPLLLNLDLIKTVTPSPTILIELFEFDHNLVHGDVSEIDPLLFVQLPNIPQAKIVITLQLGQNTESQQ